jgi:hypothetical protein
VPIFSPIGAPFGRLYWTEQNRTERDRDHFREI